MLNFLLFSIFTSPVKYPAYLFSKESPFILLQIKAQKDLFYPLCLNKSRQLAILSNRNHPSLLGYDYNQSVRVFCYSYAGPVPCSALCSASGEVRSLPHTACRLSKLTLRHGEAPPHKKYFLSSPQRWTHLL